MRNSRRGAWMLQGLNQDAMPLVEANQSCGDHWPENAGALFQVASQLNLLEMTGPEVTPEDGVTIYQDDRTQGPACAIAAGAATIYRNYFAPVGGGYLPRLAAA